MRKCTECGQEKDESDFDRMGRGLWKVCRACRGARPVKEPHQLRRAKAQHVFTLAVLADTTDIERKLKILSSGLREMPEEFTIKVKADTQDFEASLKGIPEKIRKLAQHYEIDPRQVNPYEALFYCADVLKELLEEIKGLRADLQSLQPLQSLQSPRSLQPLQPPQPQGPDGTDSSLLSPPGTTHDPPYDKYFGGEI